MNNIKYQIIPITEENIILLETIRFDAYGMNKDALPPENSFHANELRKGKYLVFACSNDNELIGACYTSKLHNSLYIEQLFIKKEYQGKQFGKNLLQYVLNNKNIAEKYFDTHFDFSYLDNYKGTTNFYQSLGYTEKDSYMKKRL